VKGFVIVIRASSSTSKFILIVMESKELMHFQISSVIALSLSLSLSETYSRVSGRIHPTQRENNLSK
jgi:hypothetical protein